MESGKVSWIAEKESNKKWRFESGKASWTVKIESDQKCWVKFGNANQIESTNPSQIRKGESNVIKKRDLLDNTIKTVLWYLRDGGAQSDHFYRRSGIGVYVDLL